MGANNAIVDAIFRVWAPIQIKYHYSAIPGLTFGYIKPSMLTIGADNGTVILMAFFF